MVIEIIIEILVALTFVNIIYYFMRYDLVVASISQFHTNEHWRAVLLGMSQVTLGFKSPNIRFLSISNLLQLNLDAFFLVIVWFIIGLLVGIKSSNWKQAVFVGLITPLSQSQLYIMMLQQYVPSLWQSFTPEIQQSITYNVYYNGIILGGCMIIGLLIPTSYNLYKKKKQAKVEYIVPEELRVKLEIKCPNCGKVHFSKAKYCSNCGALLYKEAEQTTQEEEISGAPNET